MPAKLRGRKPRAPRNAFEKRTFEALRASGANARYEPFALLYQLPPSKYTPDFVLYDGEVPRRIIETKGFLSPEDRRKMLAVKVAHPNLDIRILLYRDDRISKKSRYSDWCKAHGFPVAVKTIPPDWLQ